MKLRLLSIIFIILYAFFIGSTILQDFHYTITDYWAFAGFAILYVLLSLFPITLKRTSITFVTSLSLAVFLLYGFYVEAWLMQISVVITLLSLKSRILSRYLINMIMFLITSFASAAAYEFMAGAPHMPDNLLELPYPAIIAYIITHFLVNECLLRIARKWLFQGQGTPSFSDFIWEFSTSLLITPLGLLLYWFFIMIGPIAILYFGIPFIGVSFLFKVYKEITRFNERLRALNLSSSRFTAKLEIQDSLNEIFESISQLFPSDYQYIWYLQAEENVLVPLGIRGNLNQDEISQFMALRVKVGDGISGKAALWKKLIRKNLQSKDEHFENEPGFIYDCQSVISVPMIRNGQTIGVITLLHKENNAFHKADEFLLQVLANQAGVALYNAHRYEFTQKQIYVDELTGVYNYRSYENKLFRVVQECDAESKPVSLLIIDIDHFKSVNDTYGHLAGNQVLKQIASLLRDQFQGKGTIFRFGGEEFVILLPRVDEDKAFHYAEKVRRLIESSALVVSQCLERPGMHTIRVTVSIGVSTYPTQSLSPTDLFRNADRAMYLGAKQAGRNKVASYSSF